MNKLVTVTNKDFISNLKKGDVTLVYPLRFFSVGYEEYFDIKDIDDFVLVNRILNDEELNNLEEILVSSDVKGIMFDDLGILDIVKDMNITKILILDHISNNTSSINSYLESIGLYDNFKHFTAITKKQSDLYDGLDKIIGRSSVGDDVENDNTATSLDLGNNVSDIKKFHKNVCAKCGIEILDEQFICDECLQTLYETRLEELVNNESE